MRLSYQEELRLEQEREAERVGSSRLTLFLVACGAGCMCALCGVLFAFTLELAPALLSAGAGLVTTGATIACYRVMER